MFKKKEAAQHVEPEKAGDEQLNQQDYNFIRQEEQNQEDAAAAARDQDQQKTDTDANNELTEYAHLAEIKEEETSLLWDYYSVKEYEGLERFDNSISKHGEFEKGIAKSKDISDLANLIGETNKKLQMSFKREHKYDLKIYEEQLYKEVMFDARPSHV